jgi:hypothetical protein
VAVAQLGGGEFGLVDSKLKGLARHQLPRAGRVNVDKPKRAAGRGFRGDNPFTPWNPS